MSPPSRHMIELHLANVKLNMAMRLALANGMWPERWCHFWAAGLRDAVQTVTSPLLCWEDCGGTGPFVSLDPGSLCEAKAAQWSQWMSTVSQQETRVVLRHWDSQVIYNCCTSLPPCLINLLATLSSLKLLSAMMIIIIILEWLPIQV